MFPMRENSEVGIIYAEFRIFILTNMALAFWIHPCMMG